MRSLERLVAISREVAEGDQVEDQAASAEAGVAEVGVAEVDLVAVLVDQAEAVAHPVGVTA